MVGVRVEPPVVERASRPMNVIHDLKREHRSLRATARTLGASLRTGDDAWGLLRETSAALSRQLQAHGRREARLLVVHRAMLNTEYLALAVGAHADEMSVLERINHFFAGAQRRPLEIIRPRFTRLLETLHQQMERQEAQLFPVIEDALMLSEAGGPAQAAGSGVLVGGA